MLTSRNMPPQDGVQTPNHSTKLSVPWQTGSSGHYTPEYDYALIQSQRASSTNTKQLAVPMSYQQPRYRAA